MKKGISDAAFLPAWKTNQFLLSAKNAGFEGVELNLHENEGILTLNSSLEDVELLSKQCNEFGLEVPSISTILHNQYPFTSSNAVIRQRSEEIALKMIEVAEVMGAEIIQIVPGKAEANISYDRAYEMSQESLARLAPKAYRAGITIGVENVSNKFLPSPREFNHFLDEINHSSIQAYFDIGNAMATGYPEHWISLLSKRIVAIHAKDYKLADSNFVPSLEGDINWSAIMELLCKIDFVGYVMSTPPPPYVYCRKKLIEKASSDLTTIFGLN